MTVALYVYCFTVALYVYCFTVALYVYCFTVALYVYCFTVALYGGAGIGMAFMAMNLGGTVLQVR